MAVTMKRAGSRARGDVDAGSEAAAWGAAVAAAGAAGVGALLAPPPVAGAPQLASSRWPTTRPGKRRPFIAAPPARLRRARTDSTLNARGATPRQGGVA